MEQTITIKVPEGKEIIQKKESDGSIRIEFIDRKPIKSKSWEEFCKNHPNEFPFVDYVYCPIDLSKEIYTLIKLTKLHDEWVKDWKQVNGKMCYTYVHSYDGKIRVSCSNDQWSKLMVFPTQEMACEFLDCFKDLLEKAKRFI